MPGKVADGFQPRILRQTQPSQAVVAEATVRHQVEPPGQLDVVAEFRMHVERQMIGEQTDVMRQQQLQAPVLGTDDACILPFPEVAVMHDDRIRAGGRSRLQQGQAGGDAGDDLADLAASIDLQAIWAIVAKTVNIERLLQMFCNPFPTHRFTHYRYP